MKLPPDFRKTLAEKTDQELYQMLAQADDYLSEALAAAREELGRRNLAPERVVDEVESVKQACLADEASMNAEPLAWPLRISILIFGATVGIPAALYYSTKGSYKRKQRESLIWILYAIGFWLGMGVLIGILSALKII
jgi:hypothetical protein